MKVDKYNLKIDIEHIISEGILYAEEVDVTTQKIMDRINDLILAAERADPKKVLKQKNMESPMTEHAEDFYRKINRENSFPKDDGELCFTPDQLIWFAKKYVQKAVEDACKKTQSENVARIRFTNTENKEE